MSAVAPLITEIRKIELNCSGVLDLKGSVVGVLYLLLFASTFALLSTRKRVTSSSPLQEEHMRGVHPLITEIRKIELKYSGVLDLKGSVVGV